MRIRFAAVLLLLGVPWIAVQAQDNYKPGPNTDADPQPVTGCELAHSFDQSQSSAYCAFGIVLVRQRIAEINQRAVTQVLRHKPIVASDDSSDACVVGRDHLSQILRIETRGESSRTYQIAEHHGQLSALA